DRELFHTVGLDDGWVDDGCSRAGQLGEYRVEIVHPEKSVPGSALRLVGTDECRVGHALEHDAARAADIESELRRLPRLVFTAESQDVLVVGPGGRDIGHGKVSCGTADIGPER